MRLDITHDAELGEVMINHGFPGIPHPLPPADEVAARGARFQAGRVDRGPRHAPLASHVFPHRRIEQAVEPVRKANNRRAAFCSVV